jgi:glycosyltransferase involved in cell wall biosynthesis
MPVSVSVIISTYNKPEWLKKVLLGYCNQEIAPFEVLIADDGSGDETAKLIEAMRPSCPFNLRHIWQKDDGFRKSRILNKAILLSRGDYLIFTDGDCIPRRDFLKVHIDQARPGYYLSGTYFKLPMSTSLAIEEAHIASGLCFQLPWLHAHGLSYFKKTYKIALSGLAAKIMNTLTTTRCNLKGSNASVWRSDALAINGYDERMPWGGQDREFGVRLINSGIKPKHVRYDAIVVHLDHSRGYVDPAAVKRNRDLRLFNEKNKVVWTDFGLDKIDASQIIERC